MEKRDINKDIGPKTIGKTIKCEICGGINTYHALGCVKNIAINKAYNDAIAHCIEVLEVCETKQDAINLLKTVGEVRLSMTKKMKESIKKLIAD